MLLQLFFTFCFGTAVGSFLNVVIDRSASGESALMGRSRCDFCKKRLKAFDLIPVISFLILKGKCRYCHKKLSFQYPLVEIITGCLFAGIYLLVAPGISPESYLKFILLASVAAAFLTIFIADIKYMLIPDLAIVISSFGAAGLSLLSGNLGINLLSGVGALALLLIIFLITRGRGMGFGDVKLAFALGLFLGYPQVLIAIYLSFLTGAAVSLILILLKKKKLKNQIAFGPFLISGAVMSFFWGEAITKWYQSLF